MGRIEETLNGRTDQCHDLVLRCRRERLHGNAVTGDDDAAEERRDEGAAHLGVGNTSAKENLIHDLTGDVLPNRSNAPGGVGHRPGEKRADRTYVIS